MLVAVWRVRLGRVTLYLLDTDLEENAPWDRELSARLYGGDRETRVQQEIILGIGGVRALKALGYTPGVFHLNEGHAAFVVLQRIRDLIEQGASFDVALDEIRAIDGVHDAHAGAGRARRVPVLDWSRSTWPAAGARSASNRDRFLALGAYDNGGGRAVQHDRARAALGRRASTPSASCTARSRARCGRRCGPASAMPTVRSPSVTNGVHVPDVDRRRARRALLRPPRDATGSSGTTTRRCGTACSRFRTTSCGRCGRRCAATSSRSCASAPGSAGRVERVGTPRVVAAGTLLEPETLTIGFARRFAGYKRPELIFHDPERLARILNAAERPVQIIFAGKAHPADDIGKHHLQRVYRRALDPMFGGRVAFVDDYDLHVAHFLVQGCDVWLNNPRKPLEASGTSGMKAAINGVPHLSIGDGWWAEGFNGDERLADRRRRRPRATRRG